MSVTDIEKELTNLRRNSQKPEKGAALFNLLIYTEETRRTQYCSELVARVTDKFPCRIFFIQKEKGQTDSFDCAVSLSKADGPDAITCDRITLRVSGKGIEKVPFVIVPHLIPDLPTFLLWGEDPCHENELLTTLGKISTSMIFDSECADSLPQFCRTMLQYLKRKSELVDLNWARLGGWREIIAKTFDSKEKIDSLASTKLIQISYAVSPTNGLVLHPESQAIYMQAWIASTLGWKFTSFEKNGLNSSRLYYQNNNDTTVMVEVLPHKDNSLPEGSILALEISGELKHFFAIFTRKETSGNVSAALSNDETCDLPLNFLLPNYQQRASFLKEIFFASNTEHYFKMLEFMAQQEIL